MFDSLIFDMDGTLVNFVKEITKAWNMSCKKHNWGKQFNEEQLQNIMGLTSFEIGKIFFPEIDERTAQERVEICCKEEIEFLKNNMGKTYIPSEDFLKKLIRKYKLFIVSNCLKGYIEVFLNHFHYEKYFVETLNSSTGLTKGQNIKALVEKYDLKKPVYIGDTIKDKMAADEANVFFIHAAYGFGHVDCINKISKLEELLTY